MSGMRIGSEEIMSVEKEYNAGRQHDKIMKFESICHRAGLKVTPQRLAIYRLLSETHEHPSAEMVFRMMRKQFPNISLDTVNRTLLTLSNIGLAFAIEGSGDAKRFDANTQSHQHFKCVSCKKIIDFHHRAFDNIRVPDVIGRRCTILRKTVYFEGLCEKCRRITTRRGHISS
jgi:Fur family peroxide stress response transcriptional regulator